MCHQNASIPAVDMVYLVASDKFKVQLHREPCIDHFFVDINLSDSPNNTNTMRSIFVALRVVCFIFISVAMTIPWTASLLKTDVWNSGDLNPSPLQKKQTFFHSPLPFSRLNGMTMCNVHPSHIHLLYDTAYNCKSWERKRKKKSKAKFFFLRVHYFDLCHRHRCHIVTLIWNSSVELNSKYLLCVLSYFFLFIFRRSFSFLL